LIQTVRYGGVSLLALLLVLACTWPWVSPPARVGILAAAAVAYPVQMVAFFLLVRHWDGGKRFLLFWVGGTVVRMGVILLAALAVSQMESLPPAPTLIAMAGFFFGLLLLEPLFLRPGGTETTETL
jgi:hypothetical protein